MLSESLRFAWRGVTANKVRSALTMLGVLIGVASVIVLVAAGNGASQSVNSTLSSLGTNTLTVTPGTTTTTGFGRIRTSQDTAPNPTGTLTRPATLSLADAVAILDPNAAPDVVAVAPVISINAVVASTGSASHTVASSMGTTADYLAIADDTVSLGRTFTSADDAGHNRVVLVGPTIARELGGGDGSGIIDQQIRLNGTPFTVVGILEAKGTTGARDSDDRLIAPLSAAQDHLVGYADLSSIAVQARSTDDVEAARAQVEAILDHRRHTGAGSRDFTVTTSASMLSAASSITGTLTIMLGAIAAISLLVGGIGVMNIMLVTVTERTREIGIRKAIGADKAGIVMQFLIEAVLLSGMGGVAGVALGIGLSQIEISGFRAVVSPSSVVVAFGFALAVGLFFGIYPATRAASLRPIDALRHE